MSIDQLPAVNATLNAVAAVLLTTGWIIIKQQRVTAHRNCMIAAFAVSAVFLITYVAHKIGVRGVHTPYNGEGVIKIAYTVMLISHILLAMAVPVLAIIMIRLGIKGRLETHRRLGRVALPIWMYVSVTGVLIYMMLYHWNPS